MDRPFVSINMAMTVDGKITSARREYPRITSPFDRDRMDRLRADSDAILVGAGTMRADNPKLHVRSEAMREYRLSLGKPAGLMRVLVTASAELDPQSRFFDDADGGDRIIATTETAPARRLAELGERAEIWKLGDERVDLAALLDRVAQRGAARVIGEGGGELNWHLIRDGLVDEIYVTIAPTLLGGRDAPTLLEGEGLTMKAQQRLRLVDLHREGDELYCRYAVLH
jgi:2,5-diamino-6-(ribosylamino)-4(3H)-pyrimidinone 5'-phosphate reductase